MSSPQDSSSLVAEKSKSRSNSQDSSTASSSPSPQNMTFETTGFLAKFDTLTNDNDDNSFANRIKSFFLRVFSPFIYFNNHSNFMNKLRTKFSLFKLYILVLVILVIPSILYLDASINQDFSLELSKNTDPLSPSSYSYKKLQHAATSALNEIILPPIELIQNQTLLLDQNYNDYLFDPRLSSYLWLYNLKNHLIENNGILKPDFKLPFYWNDWVDLKGKLTISEKVMKEYVNDHANDDDFLLKDIRGSHDAKYYRSRLSKNLNCNDLRVLFGYSNLEKKEDPFYQCHDLVYEERNDNMPYYPHLFTIQDYSNKNLKLEARVLTSAAYLYNMHNHPDRLVFLGAGINGSAVTIVPENDPNSHKTPHGVKFNLLKDYLHRESIITGFPIEEIYSQQSVNLFDLVSEIQDTYNTDFSLQPYYKEEELLFDQSYLLKLDSNVENLSYMNLTVSEFIWDKSSIFNELSSNVDKIKSQLQSHNTTQLSTHYKFDTTSDVMTLEQSLDYKLLNKMQYTIDNTKGNDYGKYLKESTIGDKKGDHFDWRFFSVDGIRIPAWERRAVIHRMGRAYLRFCYSFNIKSWIAYGTMLGWYRNGLSLEWDEDIDVVMTVGSMYKIAKYNNQSLIVDTNKDDKFGSGLGSYFVDLGSPYISREKGNGANAIDGRFIDTNTGIYIDLTALAYTNWFGNDINIDDGMRKMIDPEFDHNSKEENLDKEKYSNTDAYRKYIDSEIEKKYKDKETYHCKNNNMYLLEELSPLVPTFFEGVRTFVPHANYKLLNRKYPGALQRNNEDGPGYIYKPYLRLWTKKGVCPANDNDGEFCFNEEVIEEYRRTKDYTSRHAKLMELDDKGNKELTLKLNEESHPMIFDRFIIDYAASLNAKIE